MKTLASLACLLALQSCSCGPPAPERCPRSKVMVDGQCVTPFCTPNLRICTSPTHVQACNADGSAAERITCPGDRRCFEGACIEMICTPNDERCEATGRQRCSADGQTWEPAPCPEGQGCTTAEDGTVSCAERSCEPGARRCIVHGERQPSLQICDDQGVAWRDERCNVSLNEVCMEVDGRAGCHRRLCTPDERGCFDRVSIGRCNATGTGWERASTCDAELGELCSQGRCVSECELAAGSSSYVGCEFFAVELGNLIIGRFASAPYAVVLANPGSGDALVNITHLQSVGGLPVFARAVSNHQANAVILHSHVKDAQGQLVAGYEQLHGPTENVPIPAGGSATLLLRTAGGERFNAGPESPGDQGTGLDHRSFRIQTSRPLIAYQFNPLCCNDNHTNDASLLLPVSGMGNRYHSFAGPTWSSRYPGLVTLVATRDDTQVVFDFTDAPEHRLNNGAPGLPPIEDGLIRLSLSPYQTVTLTSGPLGDLTGIRMTSNKPVGVFGGHVCTQVPFGSTACDHLEEQLLPDETWGTRYVAAPFHFRDPQRLMETTYYRFQADEEGAQIQFEPPITALIETAVNAAAPYANGVQVQPCSSWVQGDVLNLPANANCEFNSQLAFVAEAEERFAVVQFMSGQASTSGQQHAGDPAMMVVPPADQFRSRYMFLTPQTYYVDYLTVVGGVDPSLTLDGETISDRLCQGDEDAPCVIEPHTQIGNSEWGFTILRMNDGPHLIESRSGLPFGIMVYAYDDYVSYAYPGGLDLTKY